MHLYTHLFTRLTNLFTHLTKAAMSDHHIATTEHHKVRREPSSYYITLYTPFIHLH